MNRILLVTPYFYPHKGGSQQYAEELHYTLMQQNPDVKVDVLCYNTDNAPSIEKYRGFTIYRIPAIQILPGQFALPNYISLFKRVHKLMKKNHYTVINSHTRFFESSWWVPVIAKIYATKSVLTDHCADHPTHTSRFVSLVAKGVDTLLVPVITKMYSAITVTNSATYSFLKTLGVDRPVIIYGGVDTTFFSPKKKRVRTVNGVTRSFTQDDIIVTFVGRMIASKGAHLLLKAAQNVYKKYPQATFIFAGDGPLYPTLSRQKSDRIHFLGAQNKDQIADLMRATDILVHPSLHNEGFPNVLLESGASGCAVITTDQGGTKEIITHDKTGVIIEPTVEAIEHALTTLIEEPKTRNTFGKALRTWVESTYSWEHIAKEYARFLNHLSTKR